MIEEPMLNVQQVADKYGVSRQVVYIWIRLGKLAHVHTPGGQIRIPSSELSKFTPERHIQNSKN